MSDHKQPSIDLTEDDMMGESSENSLPNENDNTHKIDFASLTQNEDKNSAENILLQEKLAAAQEKYLHLAAEMENMRKRGEQRLADAHKYATTKLLEELIPVADSLELSLNVQETDNVLASTMREGMQLTLQMLTKTLEKFGVKEINPLPAEIFNPSLHEVMMVQEAAGTAPNTILSVLQKGYQLYDRLIRPARVIVVKT